MVLDDTHADTEPSRFSELIEAEASGEGNRARGASGELRGVRLWLQAGGSVPQAHTHTLRLLDSTAQGTCA